MEPGDPPSLFSSSCLIPCHSRKKSEPKKYLKRGYAAGPQKNKTQGPILPLTFVKDSRKLTVPGGMRTNLKGYRKA